MMVGFKTSDDETLFLSLCNAYHSYNGLDSSWYILYSVEFRSTMFLVAVPNARAEVAQCLRDSMPPHPLMDTSIIT